MTFTAFLFVYASFAAAMAFWIDVRFPKLTPDDLRHAMIRLVVGVVVVHGSLALSEFALRPFSAPTEAWIVLGLGFALLTIGMLTTLWVLKVARGMLGGSGSLR